ncbi:MAG: hypothetical protein EBS05_27580, partial [Proteobacteria bacterium]|nr:hypothetical protein [Pseudomonadota bacterium]
MFKKVTKTKVSAERGDRRVIEACAWIGEFCNQPPPADLTTAKAMLVQHLTALGPEAAAAKVLALGPTVLAQVARASRDTSETVKHWYGQPGSGVFEIGGIECVSPTNLLICYQCGHKAYLPGWKFTPCSGAKGKYACVEMTFRDA